MRPPVATPRLPIVGDEINTPFKRYDKKLNWITVFVKEIKGTTQDKVLTVLFDECSGRTEERTLCLAEWGVASTKGKWYIPIPAPPEALSKRKHKHRISRQRAIARMAKSSDSATSSQLRPTAGIKAPRHLMTPPVQPILIPQTTAPINQDIADIPSPDRDPLGDEPELELDVEMLKQDIDAHVHETLDKIKKDLDRTIDERLNQFLEQIKTYVAAQPSTSSQTPQQLLPPSTLLS